LFDHDAIICLLAQRCIFLLAIRCEAGGHPQNLSRHRAEWTSRHFVENPASLTWLVAQLTGGSFQVEIGLSVPASEGFHMLKYVLLVIGLMFSLASSANAATVILKNYKAHQNDDLYKAYLDGLREGLIAFNEELAFTGQQRRFCMPRNLARTVEQADDIMMREAAKMTILIVCLFSVILIDGLKDTFPCDERH
jgi:hypothetical protein